MKQLKVKDTNRSKLKKSKEQKPEVAWWQRLGFWAGWYQIRNLVPSKNRNICGPSVIWSTNESMVNRPIIDVVLMFGEEGIVLVI
ncbi:hypothetical protein AVEN_77616-1 [Araneus ventricosus]|uniref:Uncharacterized protein n=1 Tax=Araneus ventricosus TaxID=182803 RepID=A0A4Y2P8D8_ARAVE|nr:hypothetical protein AVEN_77616-1 [Araneus ventricosus]